MSHKQYLISPATSGTVFIQEIIQPNEDKPPIVRLTATWFHPQGGGQKADVGTIGPARVLHVTHNAIGTVDHYVESAAGLEVGQAYSFQIDQAARRLNTAYHSAGHLIAGVVEKAMPGWKAVAGHQWPGEARVEFESAAASTPPVEDFTPQLASLLQSQLSSHIAVSITGDPFQSRGIQIGDLPVIPCGGTHVQSLSEIQTIRITAIKRKGARTRISYEVEAL